MRSVDIAKLAGVSRSTVSRVLNKYSNVPENTRKKVEDAIKRYGYIPNNCARNLKGKSNKVIGLFFVDYSWGTDKHTIQNSPFFSKFIAYTVDKAEILGYNILISVIKNKTMFSEVEILFRNKTISGAIFMGDEIEDTDIENLIVEGSKIVLYNQKNKTNNSNVILINSNNVKGAYLATQKLVENGHRKIGHITGNINKLSVIERFEGFEKKLKEEKIEINPNYISYGSLHREIYGYEAMKNILEINKDNYPTAIFAASDLLMIGALKAIKEFGLNVPKDISIIGFDDIDMCKFSDPPLSTIACSFENIANEAVGKLIELIEVGELDSNIYCLPELEVKERQSIKNIK